MHASRNHRISRLPFFHTSDASLPEPGVLALLFLPTLAYAATGEAFALDASLAAEWESPIAEAANITADAGGVPLRENALGAIAASADYFAAGYSNLGRDGDGNVTTYEHD